MTVPGESSSLADISAPHRHSGPVFDECSASPTASKIRLVITCQAKRKGEEGKWRARKFLLNKRDGIFTFHWLSLAHVVGKGGWAVCSLARQACPGYIFFSMERGCLDLERHPAFSATVIIVETRRCQWSGELSKGQRDRVAA